MWLWLIIAMLVAGSLAAGDYVIALVPKAEEWIEKIKPYKGWIGLVFVLNGLWFILWYGIFNIGTFFTLLKYFSFFAFILYLSALVASLLMAAVGFLIGFEKIAELTGKGDQLEEIREKVAPHERNLGLASLGMAVWLLVFWILA